MRKFNIILGSLALIFSLILSCENPIDNPGQEGPKGSLTISVGDAVSKSLTPALSMNPASYEVIGTGPNGTTFNQTISSGTSVTVTKLAFGSWSVSVTAKNASGTAIGVGTGTTTVVSNASTTLNITVKPYDGFGTLSLGLTWPSAKVQTAQVTASLTPSVGAPRNLSFSVDGAVGSASFSANDVSTGYHTLVLKLLDNGYLNMGAVEIVRIVKDQTTSGSFAFTNINQATGTINVNVTPDMALPLDVSIAGASAKKPENQTMNLSASVLNYVDNVTYVWYVNGDAKGTGSSFAFDSTYAQGYYRIDITAFSADGKRAGSQTTNVQVVGAVVSNSNYVSPNIGTLVYVPAGSFQRDSNPVNISVITKPFRMGKYEITRAQFLAVMGVDPLVKHSRTSFSSGLSDPVMFVSWYQAIVFCNKLSSLEGLAPVYSVSSVDFQTIQFDEIPTLDRADWNNVNINQNANGYRLPTEAEWKWAAMGAPSDGQNGDINTSGHIKQFAGSDLVNSLSSYAVFGFWGNEVGRNLFEKSNPIGTKLPNEIGIFDMSGNASEWNWDQYSGGIDRIVHGGNFGDYASYCSISQSQNWTPSDYSAVIGLRVVRN